MRVVRDVTGSDVDREAPLMDSGVDSLAAAEVASRLRALTGVALSPTLIFEQPTARAIASELLELRLIEHGFVGELVESELRSAIEERMASVTALVDGLCLAASTTLGTGPQPTGRGSSAQFGTLRERWLPGSPVTYPGNCAGPAAL